MVYFLEEEWHSDQNLNLFTDSSASAQLGCGAYLNGEWYFFSWPKNWKYIDGHHDMTILEFIPVVLSDIIWTFYVDNQTLVAVLIKLTSKSELVMVLVRAFVLKCMLHNILFRAFQPNLIILLMQFLVYSGPGFARLNQTQGGTPNPSPSHFTTLFQV